MTDEQLHGTSRRAVMGIRLAPLQEKYISLNSCEEFFHYSSVILPLVLASSFYNKKMETDEMAYSHNGCF